MPEDDTDRDIVGVPEEEIVTVCDGEVEPDRDGVEVGDTVADCDDVMVPETVLLTVEVPEMVVVGVPDRDPVLEVVGELVTDTELDGDVDAVDEGETELDPDDVVDPVDEGETDADADWVVDPVEDGDIDAELVEEVEPVEDMDADTDELVEADIDGEWVAEEEAVPLTDSVPETDILTVDVPDAV